MSHRVFLPQQAWDLPVLDVWGTAKKHIKQLFQGMEGCEKLTRYLRKGSKVGKEMYKDITGRTNVKERVTTWASEK